MDNETTTPQATFVRKIVCTNNDVGDGTPCFWYDRERRVAISSATINVGQGLLVVPVVRCECGSYPREPDLGPTLPADLGAPGKGPT